MRTLLLDLRYALRFLVKNRWYTLLCVLTLALGIAANSTIFSWINATLLNPIPGAQRTGEIVSLTRGDLSDSPTPPYSAPDFVDLRAQTTSFAGLLGFHHEPMGITGNGRPVRVWGTFVTANFFDILGVRLSLGRGFNPQEESAVGSGAVTVLSYALWQSQFASDPGVVGRTIHINRHPLTVIGVTPREFQGAMPAVRSDLWVPVTMDPVLTGGGRIRDRGTSWLNVLGRLKPGVDRATAQQETNAIVQRLAQQFPDDHRGPNQVVLDPMWRSPFGGNVYFAAFLPLLLAMSALVLLLACANVANLMLVRAIGRRKEMAIRLCIGSSRARMLRQAILESLLVAFAAALLAVALTFWSGGLLGRFIPSSRDVAIGLQVGVDGTVVAATFLISALASVCAGVVPAFRISRVDPVQAIKEEAGTLAGGALHSRLSSSLVVAQISLSLLLLVCAGLFARSVRNAQRADPGFDPHNVLMAAYDLKPNGYSEASGMAFDKALLAKVRSLPGVEAATLTNWLPLGFSRRTTNVNVDGYVPQQRESMEIRIANVGPDYLHTLRNPVIAGRDITEQDVQRSQPVAVVNRAFVDRFWKGADPIGKRIEVWSTWRTVVGVAETARYRRLDEPPEPFIYVPLLQDFDNDTVLLVRAAGDVSSITPAVEQAIHELDADLPVFDVFTLREQVRTSSTFQRIGGAFAGAFGLLSLALAGVGLYAVVAYTTRQRTHEIGIRMALGAPPRRIFRQVLRQALLMTAVGLLIGGAMAAALTPFLRAQLLGVGPGDPLTYFAVALLLCAISVIASLLPAIRAARVQPLVALRHE